jgi:hypothetical protein
MKRPLAFAFCLGALSLMLAAAVAASGEQSQEFGSQAPHALIPLASESVGTLDERITRGFAIAPVPLNLTGKDRDLVGLGSYIVNAQGGCNDCHTNPPYEEGGDPFRGQPMRINADRYLAGGTAFGPFVSRNLTPRSNGLPANLEFDEFRISMRTGRDLKRRAPRVPSEELDLLQVMPWPVYGQMRLVDLRAIYEYLRAIQSLPSTP